MTKPNKRKRRKGQRKTQAQRADLFNLYQRAVQAPEAAIEFFDHVYRRHRGRSPRLLREDFCGTAYLSVEWAKSHQRRFAVAVDWDREPLEWGRRHNLGAVGCRVRERVSLIHADVLEVTEPEVDVNCAMNFSFCCFKSRPELRRYFAVVHQGLRDDGLLVLELYGGTEAMVALKEKRDLGDCTYVWEQKSFNPISHHTLCFIHFRFRDGSRLRRAFTYDWRLWTIPELRDLLQEVGFSAVEIYWEQVDDDGEGTGEYRLTEEEENQEGWLVYVVAVK